MTFYNNGRVMDSNSGRMGNWNKNSKANNPLTVSFNNSGEITTSKGG